MQFIDWKWKMASLKTETNRKKTENQFLYGLFNLQFITHFAKHKQQLT